MNYFNASQENLSLEAVWGTPDGWLGDVSGKHILRKGAEQDMFFAYEEFIVTGKEGKSGYDQVIVTDK